MSILKEMEFEYTGSEFKVLPITKLEPNDGQLDGLKSNPREISESKFDLLKKNVAKYPNYLTRNPLKVFLMPNGNYIVVGGNMRLRAMQEMGYKNAPCAILDPLTTIEELNAYVIIDNTDFGKWDWDKLANEWEYPDLQCWGLNLPIAESEINIDEFFDNIDKENEKEKDEKIIISLPDEYADLKDEIKDLIETTLAEYEGVKIK